MRSRRFVASNSASKWHGILSPARFFLYFSITVSAMLSLPGNAAAQTYIPTEAQQGQSQWGISPYAKRLQKTLGDLGCYSGSIDGKWWNQSQTALDDFLVANLGTKLLPSGSNTTRSEFESFLKGATRTRCGAGGGPSKTCHRATVGRDYLRGRTKKAQVAPAEQLAAPLQFVIKNYEKVFDGDKSLSSGLSAGAASALRDILKKYGADIVTHQKTLEALNLAKKRFNSLIFQYGYDANGACGQCVLINNWLYLKNYAQNRGGRIFHSDPKKVIRGNFGVDDITLEMMHAVRDRLLVHRRISAKWLSVINAKKISYDFKSPTPGRQGESITETITIDDLDRERQMQMNEITKSLIGIKTKDLKVAEEVPDGEKKMSEIIKDYDCKGFDGSSLYEDQ